MYHNLRSPSHRGSIQRLLLIGFALGMLFPFLAACAQGNRVSPEAPAATNTAQPTPNAHLDVCKLVTVDELNRIVPGHIASGVVIESPPPETQCLYLNEGGGFNLAGKYMWAPTVTLILNDPSVPWAKLEMQLQPGSCCYQSVSGVGVGDDAINRTTSGGDQEGNVLYIRHHSSILQVCIDDLDNEYPVQSLEIEKKITQIALGRF